MENNLFAPVIIFAFNRYDLFVQLISSLKNNHYSTQTDLFIFIDGPRNQYDKQEINKIVNFIPLIGHFKSINVYSSEVNKGLANSIISGVSEIINIYGKAIILEDDLMCSTNFLKFMNDSLNYYQENKNVFSISGYSYNFPLKNVSVCDVYFHNRNSTWGWATWKDRWNGCIWDKQYFENEVKDLQNIKILRDSCNDLPNLLNKYLTNKINSWAIRWTYYQYKHQGLTVYPILSKTRNVGFDHRATHTKNETRFDVKLDESNVLSFNLCSEVSPQLSNEVNVLFRKKFSFKSRLINKIWQILKISY